MNRAALSTLIAQLGGEPSFERMVILQEVLDALADRIESLERQVRSVRLQARAGKVFSGQKWHEPPEESEYQKAIRTGIKPAIWPPIVMTPDELEHFRISAAGGKSVNRTPAKRRKLTPR